jgi:serine/threonine protein kinase
MTQGLELRGAILGKGYRLGQRRDDIEPNTYDATHERIPGHFVIRLFPPETLSVPESASRIQRGARVASLLRDPHSVQVLDCNASGETPAFVVMEPTAGQLLSKVMAEDGMLPLSRVADLVDSMAAALAAGHQIGLVHGDLRPAHVFLPLSGQPAAKLSGFGWAKELRAATLVPAPSGYLAPEQHFGKVLTLDERVDQFGLAAMAYEMIAACLPFSEESADMAELLGRPRTPPAITDLVPGIPTILDDVLRRALSFAPSERYDSVLELAARLRDAASVGPEPAAPDAYASDEGSVPTKTNTDITEELDLATLSAVRAHDNQDHREAADDADLVLGSGESVSDPLVADDAKTQIRRSPFLDEDVDSRTDNRDRGSHEAHLARTTHAVPVWQASESDSRRHSVPLIPPDGSRLAKTTARIKPLGSKLSSVWAQARKYPMLAIPIAAGLLLILVVGAILWISSGSDSDETRAARSEGSLGKLQPSTAAAPTATNDDAPALGTSASQADPASAGTPPAAAPIRPQVEPLPPPEKEPVVVAFDPRPMRRSRTRRSAGRYAGAGAVIADPSFAGLSGGTFDGCSIRISSKPWAEVWIDGRNTGRKTPLDSLRVACGVHKLELKRPDKDIGQTEMLNLVPGVPHRGDYELE